MHSKTFDVTFESIGIIVAPEIFEASPAVIVPSFSFLS
jgi:hypothetical protein